MGQIHLDKKVPTGAGLGGGSSNAATALWAANQFSGLLATEKELQEWSSEIGSDVPFFFSQGAAYCTGRGEVCLLQHKFLVGFLLSNSTQFHMTGLQIYLQMIFHPYNMYEIVISNMHRTILTFVRCILYHI